VSKLTKVKSTKKKITATHHYIPPGIGVTVRTVVDTKGEVREADNEDESLMEEIHRDILKTIKKAKKPLK
jgi:hypothetical protein